VFENLLWPIPNNHMFWVISHVFTMLSQFIHPHFVNFNLSVPKFHSPTPKFQTLKPPISISLNVNIFISSSISFIASHPQSIWNPKKKCPLSHPSFSTSHAAILLRQPQRRASIVFDRLPLSNPLLVSTNLSFFSFHSSRPTFLRATVILRTLIIFNFSFLLLGCYLLLAYCYTLRFSYKVFA